MACMKRETALVLVLLSTVVTAGTVVGLPQPPPAPAPGEDAPTAPLEEAVVRTDRYGDPLPPGALVRMGTVRLRHGGLNGLAFSADGKTLLSVGRDRTVRVWDPGSGRELRNHPGPPQGNAFAPDAFTTDRKLLARTQESCVCVWDLDRGKERGRIPWKYARSLAFSPDGRTLAVGDGRGDIGLWDLDTLEERRHWQTTASVEALGFSPDGKRLAATSERDGPLRVWEMATGKEHLRLDTRDTQFAFSPDGDTLASIGRGPVTLWDAQTGARRAVLTLPEPDPFLSRPCVLFAPDGKTLAAGGDGRPVLLWDRASRKELHRLEVGRANLLAFAPDASTLASGATNALRVWDVRSGREQQPRGAHTGNVSNVAISPDGRLVASGSTDDDTVRLWERATGRPLHLLLGHTANVSAVAFSPDGRLLASADGDGTLRLWDPTTGKGLRTLVLKSGRADEWNQVRYLAFSPDGRSLAALSIGFSRVDGKRTHDFWACDLERGGPPVHKRGLEPGDGPENWLAPDARTVARISAEAVVLEDTANGSRKELRGKDRLCGPIFFSPRGRLLVVPLLPTEPVAGGLAIAQAGAEKWLFEVDAGAPVSSCAFSPDERYLGALTPEAVILWEIASGREVLRYRRPVAATGGDSVLVGMLAFTPDGRALATCLSDDTILLWDLTGGTESGPSRRPLRRADFDRLWEDLKGEGGPKSYAALWALAQGPPEVVVPLLRERYAPADEALVRRLVRDLDSDDFPVRQSAEKQLEDLGERAWPFFREALAANPSLEVRQRLERLQATCGRSLRALRAVEVLERIDTPAARQLLGDWAREADDAVLPREARAALERLKGRSVFAP